MKALYVVLVPHEVAVLQITASLQTFPLFSLRLQKVKRNWSFCLFAGSLKYQLLKLSSVDWEMKYDNELR
jgi:hypothetical protein